MRDPLISVITPTWNRARFIQEGLRSVLDQCPDDWEVVVVDDGSTDDTREIVTGLRHPALRYVSKPHSGAPDTRNLGIENAAGSYLLWLDSDDCLAPGVAARYGELVRTYPHADVLYGDLIVTDAELRPDREIHYENWHGRNDTLVAQLTSCCPIPNPGALVRRAAYERFGAYDPSFRRAHDFEWWSRVAGTLNFLHCGGTVALWRWHDTNMSSGSVDVDTSFEARVTRRLLHRYTLRGLFPDLSWDTRPWVESEGLACLRIASRLASLGDLNGALEYSRESSRLWPSAQAREVVALLERQFTPGVIGVPGGSRQ